MKSLDAPPLPERGSLRYFIAVCFAAALGGLLFGFDTAVISGAIGFLQAQFRLGELMLGWVVSSTLVGCVVGSAIAGWLADRFGRKWMLVLSALLFMVTALGSALAPSPLWLSTARLVGGVGVGVAAAVAPLYIAEISPPKLRGRMVALYQLAIATGVLSAYLTNAGLLELSTRGPAWATDWYQWMVVREVWRIMLGSLCLPAVVFFLWALGVRGGSPNKETRRKPCGSWRGSGGEWRPSAPCRKFVKRFPRRPAAWPSCASPGCSGSWGLPFSWPSRRNSAGSTPLSTTARESWKGPTSRWARR
jgi:MFS family permease